MENPRAGSSRLRSGCSMLEELAADRQGIVKID